MLLSRDLNLFILSNFFSSSAAGMLLILIPWLLVRESGATYLAILATIVTFIMALIARKIKYIVDEYSRSKLMSINSGVMIPLIITFIILGENIVTLTILYSYIQIYILLYYSTRSALAHELTSRDQYGFINGVLEIESQVSMFFAGGVAVFIFSTVEREYVYWISMFLFFMAFLTFLLINSKSRCVDKDQKNDRMLRTDSPKEPLSNSSISLFVAGY